MSLLNRLFGRQQPASPVGTPLSTMPGYFPEEPEAPALRNRLNSVALGQSFSSAGQWGAFLVIRPMVLLVAVVFRVLSHIVNVIYFRDHAAGATTQSAVVNDPIEKAARFVRALEENLSPEQLEAGALPAFFEGSYTQALYMAHQRAKFLFVYLAHPLDGADSLFTKIIINPDFRGLFDDHVIIWGGDVTTPEAYQLANSLNVTKFPFLGLMCLTRTTTMTPQGPVKTSAKISLVSKIQGNVDSNATQLINNKFKRRMAKYNEELTLIRAELKERYLSQVYQTQQELRYQESLAKDRLKKQQKEYEKQKKVYLAWKATKLKEVEANPGPDAARIAFKLPDGSRVSTQIPGDAPLEDVFTYVEAHLGGYFGKETTISDEEAARQFDGFKLAYGFQLLLPVPPRKTLNDELDRGVRVRDVESIYPNGMLLVSDD